MTSLLVAATPCVADGPRQPLSPTRGPTPRCVGDCNGDGSVTVNELITMVNIALGNAPVVACRAGDATGDGEITIDEILKAVNNALNVCGGRSWHDPPKRAPRLRLR